jgi:pantoate--beta-alanine ligase
MQITGSIDDVRQAVRAARSAGRRIGCVPTMGALHAGHASLIEHAGRISDFVVVTIFVNPTQFGPGEDLRRYPRPLENDLAACRAAGVSLVFRPEPDEMYPHGFESAVEVTRLSQVLEGAARPDHFRGVATVVAKLLNIVQPDVACFGQKDYQQQTLIRRMVRDLNLPVEIVVCPTVRESDGLAMSSRNIYLTGPQRQAALSLHRCLRSAEQGIRGGEDDLTALASRMLAELASHPDVDPDYAVIADADTLETLARPRSRMIALVAARLGGTRLIDNLLIEQN